MQSRFAISAIALVLAACTASDEKPRFPLEQAPIDSVMMRGDYQRLSTCAYRKFSDGTSSVMQKNDFPEIKQSRLTMMGGNFKAWELIFTQKSASQTQVELTSTQTIWGPDKISTRDVLAGVRACEATRGASPDPIFR